MRIVQYCKSCTCNRVLLGYTKCKVGVDTMPEYLTTLYHLTLQSAYMEHHRCTAVCIHI